MTQQRLTIDRERKADLRRRVLAYFARGDGQRSARLFELDEFEGFSREEIRLMIYGLDSAGLLRNVNGRSTSGAMYGLTKLGRIVLCMETNFATSS